ncbi:MAG: hypothetical protein EPN82_15895 [Bacteroidetes bacterium]|nr:MAG: hypothetical protein EPN82_15895 [Bacteroidota bacterium]
MKVKCFFHLTPNPSPRGEGRKLMRISGFGFRIKCGMTKGKFFDFAGNIKKKSLSTTGEGLSLYY